MHIGQRLSAPLPPIGAWTQAGVAAVVWNASVLHICGTDPARPREVALWHVPSQTSRCSPIDQARRLLGTALLDHAVSAAWTPLVAALWPLFQDSDPAIALPGATVKARSHGASCSFAFRPDAPAATFVLQRRSQKAIPLFDFADDFQRLLHPDVPEGDCAIPQDVSAHERLHAARMWGPELPPALDGVAWRRIRRGRVVALMGIVGRVLPMFLGLRILPQTPPQA
jgi:hypothetical protein